MAKSKNLILFFQQLSKALLTPIALLSVAALFLGISSIFLWHDALRELVPFLKTPFMQYFAQLLNVISSVIMDNLGLLFAISLAFSLAKEDKEYAGFGAAIGYLAFNMGMAILFVTFPNYKDLFPKSSLGNILGIPTLQTGVLGGIIVGLVSWKTHEWAKNVKFPIALSFYGGLRFVPTANAIVFVLIGQIFPFIWIPITKGLNAAAQGVVSTGVLAPFLYGFGERLLIPTGLHHIWNTVIRDTPVSGIFTFSDGKIIEGSRPAYNYFLTMGKAPDLGLVQMVKFLRGGHIPSVMFVLPAMALAMYKTASDKLKSKVKPMLVAGIFTALLAGVSEPLEFSFLFVSPILYLIYSVITGLGFMLTFIFGNTMGGTEPNLIGLLLYGFLQPTSKWWIPIIIGIIFAVIMYFFTKWWILKFDVKTPGRDIENEEKLEEINVPGLEGITDPAIIKARTIIYGLGGISNIKDVENCYTRLRVTTVSLTNCDEKILKATGCSGIIKIDDTNIQIIYGPTVNIIKDNVNKQMKLMSK